VAATVVSIVVATILVVKTIVAIARHQAKKRENFTTIAGSAPLPTLPGFGEAIAGRKSIQ
jgi:hypothetical protein